MVANSGDQTLKGNSGPWMAGDQVLSIDSTKSNVEYICVEMADDHPVAKQRAAMATTKAENDRLRAEAAQCDVDKTLNAVDVLSKLQSGTIKLVFA